MINMLTKTKKSKENGLKDALFQQRIRINNKESNEPSGITKHQYLKFRNHWICLTALNTAETGQMELKTDQLKIFKMKQRGEMERTEWKRDVGHEQKS